MDAVDHDSTEFDPDDMPQDYAVFFLDPSEAAGPPRTVTPYMRACAHYMTEEAKSRKEYGFVANRVQAFLGNLVAVIPFVGFMIMIFGLPLAFDPERVSLHWVGWLMSAVGAIALVPIVTWRLTRDRSRRREYHRVLLHGTLTHATVVGCTTLEGLVRELRFHKPVEQGGVTTYERQWINHVAVTISIGDQELEFVTARPELLGVFQPGARVPVLWYKDCPRLFIPVAGNAGG